MKFLPGKYPMSFLSLPFVDTISVVHDAGMGLVETGTSVTLTSSH